MGVNSLPKTVTRQTSDCDLNTGPSAPESSTLTTRLEPLPHLNLHMVLEHLPPPLLLPLLLLLLMMMMMKMAMIAMTTLCVTQ